MSVLAEFSVVPLGAGASISPRVARVLRIILDSGFPYKANPMGTVIEGEWDAVMALVKRCHDEAMKDAARVITTVRIDDHPGSGPRIERKLESVEEKLGTKLNR